MTKRKNINVSMEFNPGTMKYEPVLPLRKERENKVSFDWKWVIILLILITLFFLFFIADFL